MKYARTTDYIREWNWRLHRYVFFFFLLFLFSYIPFSLEIVCELFFFVDVGVIAATSLFFFHIFLYLTSFIGSFVFRSLALQCNAPDRCLLRHSRPVIITVAHLLSSLFNCGLVFNCNNEWKNKQQQQQQQLSKRPQQQQQWNFAAIAASHSWCDERIHVYIHNRVACIRCGFDAMIFLFLFLILSFWSVVWSTMKKSLHYYSLWLFHIYLNSKFWRRRRWM